jgi:predicted DCC family thiol-disulfide oxidoreductase YuxK
METAPDWTFKVLYDGDCPFCRLEVRWLGRWNGLGRLVFEDIADASFDPGPYGRTREELMAAIHGAYPDGRIVTGMEVFREAYRTVNLGFLLAPTGWPLLRPLFDRFYAWFARNRVSLGSVFGRRCDASACTPQRGIRCRSHSSRSSNRGPQSGKTATAPYSDQGSRTGGPRLRDGEAGE